MPYDVATRRGELKHVLLTESPDGELMLRLVLRSTALEARVRSRLPALLEAVPALRVVTINVQPEHKAVLEGEREIVLTDTATLPMRLATGVTLRLGPRSFFQTNTAVAEALYDQARAWVRDLPDVRTVWDLYCGVGGFALHLAGPGREVLGVEVSADAIAAASATSTELGRGGGVRRGRRDGVRPRPRTPSRTSSWSTRPAAASAPTSPAGSRGQACDTSSTRRATPSRWRATSR